MSQQVYSICGIRWIAVRMDREARVSGVTTAKRICADNNAHTIHIGGVLCT